MPQNPRWIRGKELPAKAEDTGLIPGGENPLKKEMATIQYSCLGNPMDRSLVATVYGVAKRVGHDLTTEQQCHLPPETSF